MQFALIILFLSCYIDMSEGGVYKYFLDNQKTTSHQALIFGMRELNASEQDQFCINRSILSSTVPISDDAFHFTSDYQLRVYTSGCYYLDGEGQWKADGLVVSDDTWI